MARAQLDTSPYADRRQVERLWKYAGTLSGKIEDLTVIVDKMQENERVEMLVAQRLRETRKGRWSLTEKIIGIAVACASVGAFVVELVPHL